MSRRPVAQSQRFSESGMFGEEPDAPPAAFLRAGPQPPKGERRSRSDERLWQGAHEPASAYDGRRSDDWTEQGGSSGPSSGRTMWVDDEPRPGPVSAVPPPKPRYSFRGAGGFGAALERWDPGITGARALAVVGLIAALAAGVLLWTSRPEPEPVPPLAGGPDSPPPPSADLRSGSAADLQAQPAAAPATALTGDPLVIHITGDVRTPGVVTLPPGSRVTDALNAAGGLRKNGKVGAVNLARRLTDGEQIIVGSDAPDPPVPVAGPAAPAGPVGPAAPLDLNTATLEQLQELPGVGPVLARRILDHRTENGLFRTVDQLQDVNGIGERRFADLKGRVHVTRP